MRGERNGLFYVEIFKSTRFKGTETLEVKPFFTEGEQQQFIQDYNWAHLDHSGVVPEVYTMAHEACWYTIDEYIRKEREKF